MKKTPEQLATPIREYLARYEIPTTASMIAWRFGVSVRMVMNTIALLRTQGYGIISSWNGYWWSDDPETVKKKLKKQEARRDGASRKSAA